MRICQLDGRRVALWGWGREGRAAYRAIRARLPELPLTLFCQVDEVDDARATGDRLLTVVTEASGTALGGFEVVVKSPGISPYASEATEARALGAQFIGGTTLWFAENADADGLVARTICVTGTKGKSTTTALIAHLLRAAGHRTALAGNIGLPLLELPAHPQPDFRVIELSSYQTGDVALSGAHPEVAVALNLFPEHLDWHGSQTRYVEDKLRLLVDARPRTAVLNADDPQLAALVLPHSRVQWFGRVDGWHLRGNQVFRGDVAVLDAACLPLPGRHNRSNLCAVLAAIEALGLDAAELAAHAATFQPLPHRLQMLGTRSGFTYINDSISTTPHASLAALECFGDRRVAILVGGHDRGIDWSGFAEAMGRHSPAAVVTMGQNGPRIAELLQAELLRPASTTAGFALAEATDLADAVKQARALLGGEGVILLSPGAPSFGPYRDYVARGRDFARLAGFDPEAISAIQGLGLA